MAVGWRSFSLREYKFPACRGEPRILGAVGSPQEGGIYTLVF